MRFPEFDVQTPAICSYPGINKRLRVCVYAEITRALEEFVEESTKGMSGTESIWPLN